MLKLNQIKELLPEALIAHPKDIEFSQIAYDSRQVKSGCLFVAIKGEKLDGHRFIPEAIQQGAVAIVTRKLLTTGISIPQIVVPDTRRTLAVLAHHFYGQPSRKIKVIGITGTNGKTTTAYLTRAILEAAPMSIGVGLLGTISYSIGKREIPAPITTPESADLAGYLAEMVSLGLQYAVIEVSSHSLIQKRVYGIDFAAGVFTNLGRDHLDFHKNIKQYRKAKSILFRQLPKSSIAVLNLDDPASKYFQPVIKARVFHYGFTVNGSTSRPPFNIEIASNTLNGLALRLHTPTGEIAVSSSLIGQHNAYNILAAVTTTYALGITDPQIIQQGVTSVKSVPGRLENVETNRPFKVLVDFAHTPNALEATLTSLKPLVYERLIVVFGCGGDRDRGKRPLMGKVAEKYADSIILTSDNPRSEDPRNIIRDIEKGLSRRKKYYIYPDRREAIEQALALVKPGDLILIAGKGHETYQISKDTVRPFDDRKVVSEILGRAPHPKTLNQTARLVVLL